MNSQRFVTELLFVYGTLHPERAPAEIADVVHRFDQIGHGSVRGRLYDRGQYPGLALAEEGERIRGVVFAVPQDALPRLDVYEGFDPAEPADSLFLRVQSEVALDGGGQLRCWIYVWNREVE